MQQFTVSHPVEVIEALMNHVGYATRTRARNALRGEILVNGQTTSRGSDILEPGAQVSVLTKEDLAKQQRTGGAAKPDSRKGTGSAVLRAPFPWCTKTTMCLSTKNRQAGSVPHPTPR